MGRLNDGVSPSGVPNPSRGGGDGNLCDVYDVFSYDDVFCHVHQLQLPDRYLKVQLEEGSEKPHLSHDEAFCQT